MSRRKVSEAELAEALQSLPGWGVEDGRLVKKFHFGSFAEAMAWMVGVAIHADKLDHHPDWANVYSTVDVTLWTHDKDAITQLDLELASRMEKLAG